MKYCFLKCDILYRFYIEGRVDIRLNKPREGNTDCAGAQASGVQDGGGLLGWIKREERVLTQKGVQFLGSIMTRV